MPLRLTGFVCPTVSTVTTGHATGVEKTLLGVTVVLGVDPSSWAMPEWDSYHNREVTTLVCHPYLPGPYTTLIY